jgi:hypothetical protein
MEKGQVRRTSALYDRDVENIGAFVREQQLDGSFKVIKAETYGVVSR